MSISICIIIKNERLFSCNWCWLQWVARGNGNSESLPKSGHIFPVWANASAAQKSTPRNLQKFASVHELTEFLLETYPEIRKYCVVPVQYKNNHSLIMQMQLLYEHFPESPSVSHFMVYTYHMEMFFQSSVYNYVGLKKNIKKKP